MSKGPGKWQALILRYLRDLEYYPLSMIAHFECIDHKDLDYDSSYQAVMRAARTLEKQGKVKLYWDLKNITSGYFESDGPRLLGRTRLVARPSSSVDISKPVRMSARLGARLKQKGRGRR